MQKYRLFSAVCVCLCVLLDSTVCGDEPKISYQEGPQYKYLFESAKAFRHGAEQNDLFEGYLDRQEEIIQFITRENEYGQLDSVGVHDPGPGIEPYHYVIHTSDPNIDITPWKDVVWQWEDDIILQEKRVEILKELARNYAHAIFDAERGRLLQLTFDKQSNAKKFPDSIREKDFVPADDSLLIRVIEAFPEIRTLFINDMGPGITDDSFKKLPRLKYLQCLTITPVSRYYCSVTDAAMPHISQYKNLVFLAMSDMHVTDKGIDCLSSLPVLNELRLISLATTPYSFISISKLPKIRSLAITFHYPVTSISRIPYVYRQEVIDAIISLDGRLLILHMSILDPDMLYAASRIISLKQFSAVFPPGGDADNPHINLFLFNRPFSYESLVRQIKTREEQRIDLIRVRWDIYENYQPQKE